jgi:hypothetical protein
MESFFGHDFSAVRVHEGPHAARLGAVAYTQGNDIHFSPGTYGPHGAAGRELLGHELTHVVQQRAGRVPVPQGKGAPINADSHLEAEADHMGRQAVRHGSPTAAAPTATAAPAAKAVTQAKIACSGGASCSCARCSGGAATSSVGSTGGVGGVGGAGETAAADREAGARLARAPIAAHAAATQRRAAPI